VCSDGIPASSADIADSRFQLDIAQEFGGQEGGGIRRGGRCLDREGAVSLPLPLLSTSIGLLPGLDKRAERATAVAEPILRL